MSDLFPFEIPEDLKDACTLYDAHHQHQYQNLLESVDLCGSFV